ncbi:FtsH protease activity modulator HflK [Amaricoccus sp. HAR-UPW-R2A-40]|nr:FtsH protease activity modulator HflK [Amaricoccus sp. HAR-UPW-R2A-40]
MTARTKAVAAVEDATEATTNAFQDTTAKVETFVADAQKTFTVNVEKFTKGIEGLTAFSQENVEALKKSSEIAAKASEGIASEVSAYSKKAFEDGVAAAQDFAAAKTLTELFEKQTAFAQSSFEGFVQQSTKMNEILAAATKDIAIAAALFGFWLLMSFYTVRPEEQAVELTFGECRGDCIGEPGLNFAPWPVVTREIVQVTGERTEEIGSGTLRGTSAGLMLTGDENIVDITFQTVWNVRDPAQFLFNLSDPRATIEAVSESAMREVVSRSDLSPILSRDRGVISQEVQSLIQATLDEYGSGVNVVRVNFDQADPPEQVIDAFREVQAARQERSTLQNRADAYANERLAAARGQSAQLLQESESYRAQQVNSAQGEASRFNAVLAEYVKAPDVTRKRLYLETMEGVLGDVQMFLVDTPNANGQGVVPFLPLNELRRPAGGDQ